MPHVSAIVPLSLAYVLDFLVVLFVRCVRNLVIGIIVDLSVVYSDPLLHDSFE